ncbi:hypothetical protein, partial [Sutterella wadsworthensis]|uniref:hypothetical protein n=1 Tax=Sutterella wadsworthensis TaxID=40545 RepID=UPI0039670A36
MKAVACLLPKTAALPAGAELPASKGLLNSKKNLAGVFPSPARFNPQFSQPKVRRNMMKSSLSSLSS